METDGPVPGLNSMLSLGAAAFTGDGALAGIWYRKFSLLPGAFQSKDTMDWWTTQPEAWAEATSDQQDPALATMAFVRWVATLKHEYRPVAVAWPAAFDFPFVNYYTHRYSGQNPLGIACLDIRSYANGLAGHPGYKGLPVGQLKAMTGTVDKTGLREHVAVDDAIEQGRLFMALRAYALQRGKTYS